MCNIEYRKYLYYENMDFHDILIKTAENMDFHDILIKTAFFEIVNAHEHILQLILKIEFFPFQWGITCVQ